MKALTVKSPWWQKILSGEKTIETRTWKTNHRGNLLICSSADKTLEDEYWHTGRMICVVNLVDVREMTKEDEKAACCPIYDRSYCKPAYAWVLENVRPTVRRSLRGWPGVFDVPEEHNMIELD